MSKARLRKILAREGLAAISWNETSIWDPVLNREEEGGFSSASEAYTVLYSEYSASDRRILIVVSFSMGKWHQVDPTGRMTSGGKSGMVPVGRYAMDHGYDQAIAGGTNVMQTLVQDLREEQVSGKDPSKVASSAADDLRKVIEDAFDTVASYRFSGGMLFVEGRMNGQLVNLQGTVGKSGTLRFEATRSLNTKGDVFIPYEDHGEAAIELRDSILHGR